MEKVSGMVYLVGAGPGDPGLITRRGAELLAKAGCVVYDRLVGPEILRLARRGSEKIYAGKLSDEGGRGQERINRLLVEKAKRHAVVVRLKGGDPAVFGRISEELEALDAAGVRHEVVPGVSSAWAAAACAGIPLTDRTLSSSVAITTGHAAAGKKAGVRWEALARGADTLVILMGRAALPAIVKRLRRAKPGSTPVALVRWASTPRQQVLVSTLDRVAKDLAARPEFTPPVTAIVGEVVRRRALEGKRILVTRPSEDAGSLNQRLKEMGAECEVLPAIEVRHKRVSAAERSRLLAGLPEYDWVIFTSRHGVEALAALAARPLKKLIKGKICAVGPRTAEAAREAGLKPALVPEESSKEGIARAFRKVSARGKKVLVLRSSLGVGDWFAAALRKTGAKVEEAVLYETVTPEISPARVKSALRGLDAATFTSGSTARSFLEALARAKMPLSQAFDGMKVVAIGPSTAQALREGGVRKVYMPKDSWTAEGLVETLVTTFSRERSERK